MPLTLSGTTGIAGVNGSAATPAAQGSGTNTGVFYGTDTVSISTGGTARVVVNSDGQTVLGAGTASLPAMSTTGDLNTGTFYPAADTIGWTTGGSERARIDSSGNLLVGTTSAVGGANPQINVCGATTNRSYFIMSRTTAATTGVCGSLQGYNGSNVVASIDYQANGANNSGYIATFTWSAGSPVQGPYVNTGGTSWTTSSDERIKNILAPITNALTKVMSLDCVYYTLKLDTSNTHRVGFTAQNMRPVLPEVVSERADGQLGIDYAATTPLLAAAIQELNAKLEAAEARIAALEAK